MSRPFVFFISPSPVFLADSALGGYSIQLFKKIIRFKLKDRFYIRWIFIPKIPAYSKKRGTTLICKTFSKIIQRVDKFLFCKGRSSPESPQACNPDLGATSFKSS